MYVFLKVFLLVEKPPFVDQNTWLLHYFPEFGKNGMTSAKLIHIYVKKQIIAKRQFYWREKLKKTEKKHQTWRYLILRQGQMGIERSMMTIVAKSPGIF